MSQRPLPGFDPPKAPLEDQVARAPQSKTVGYLIGAVLQLGLGAFWAYRGVLRRSNVVGLLGVFLLFLGLRAVTRYRRSRRVSG
jgi:hypothetical protein